MIKKIIVLLILSVPFLGNAQYIEDWQVGINVNPFYFDRLSSYYEPTDKPQNIPNGIGVGLTIEKNWNAKWGVKTGFEYSSQNKKYDDFQNIGNSIFSTVDMDFKYFKIPMTLQYSTPINENLFLTFNQGVQLSILNDYKTIIDDSRSHTVMTPGKYYIDDKLNSIYSNGAATAWFYKKTTFGIIGSVGLKGILSKRLSYSTNLRYEYDLTGSESSELVGGLFATKKENANNFRLGLELGLQYHFSLKGCGFCDMQKH